MLVAAIATLGALWAAEPPRASAAGGVLVVGDSLEVGTSPYLGGLLPGIPLTVDAQISRPSSTGVAIVRSRLQTADRVVVFDLGTNDDPAQPQALSADLAAVRSIAGDRCVVVATLNRPPYNGVSVDGLNGAVRDFAASSPPVQVVDWRSAVLSNSGLVGSDGVHGTSTGYATRAQLVARGILDCLSSSAPSVTGPPQGGSPSQGQSLLPPPAPKVDWQRLGLPNPALLYAVVARSAVDAATTIGRWVSAALHRL
jgi:hypothetical protein